MVKSPVKEAQELGLDSQESAKISTTAREHGDQPIANESCESNNVRNGTTIQTIPQIEHAERKNSLLTSIEVDIETSLQECKNKSSFSITNPHKLNNVR